MWWWGIGLAVGKRQAPVGDHRSIGRTPPPRGKEGTHAGRISLVGNVETPLRSGHTDVGGSGGLTVRKAEALSGNRMTQEAKAGRPKGQRNTGM